MQPLHTQDAAHIDIDVDIDVDVGVGVGNPTPHRKAVHAHTRGA